MSRMGLRASLITLIGIAFLHWLSHGFAGGAVQSKESSFTVTGTLIAAEGTPIKEARVVAVPVGANGEPVKFYAFDEQGRQQLGGPSAKSDSRGGFSIEIPRDYEIMNERFIKWTLVLPNFGPPDRQTGWPTTDLWLEIDGRAISIGVPDNEKPVDLGKISVK